MAECPLLALSGHALLHCECLLSGVKRTLHKAGQFPLMTRSGRKGKSCGNARGWRILEGCSVLIIY
jgi:hypothetical protein